MSIGNFSKPERRKLGSIGTLWFKGQPFKKTDIVETGKYPCLHYGELFSKYGAIIDSVSSRCDVPPKRLSQKGDILFPASDVTPAGLTRCSAIMQEDVILGGDVIGFRPQTGLNPIYLSYAIRHQKDQLLQRVTGALIKHISAKSLQSVIIPIHPIESQNRFEKQVRHLNRIISHRRTQLAKLDELVKCRFVEMFGDMIYNPNKWEEKALQSVADIVSGITKGRKISDTKLIEVPYMAVCNVKDGYIDWTNLKTILATNKEIEQYRILENDVLMTEGGDPDKVGRGAIISSPPNNCIHQNHIFRVRLSEEVEAIYFEQYLQQPKARQYFYRSAKQTTGIASINMSQLKAMPVLLPPLALQEQFAEFVRRIDKLRFVVETSHNHKHFTICGLVYFLCKSKVES